MLKMGTVPCSASLEINLLFLEFFTHMVVQFQAPWDVHVWLLKFLDSFDILTIPNSQLCVQCC